jgi:hypothetical protein
MVGFLKVMRIVIAQKRHSLDVSPLRMYDVKQARAFNRWLVWFGDISLFRFVHSGSFV